MSGQQLPGQLSLSKDRQFIHYTDANGLPYSGITDITQDTHGFMWVATRISICRFDGYSFREYSVLGADGKPAVVSNSKFFWYKNKLYLKSIGARIFQFEETEGVFREQKHLLTGKSTLFFYPGKDGFWVGEKNEVYFLEESLDSMSSLAEHFPFAGDVLQGRTCRALLEDKGILYLLLDGGFLVSIYPKEQLVEVQQYEALSGRNLMEMKADHGGGIWVRTTDAGAFRLQPQNGQWDHFSYEGEGSRHLSQNLVRTIEEDREHNIWIGTEYGLCIWNPGLDQMQYYQYDVNDPRGINSNAIYVLHCDAVGDMWVGTYFGGINLYSSNKEFFNYITAGVGDYYLGGGQVSCIEEDPEGNLYVGLEGYGFNRIDKETRTIRKFIHQDGKNSLSYDNVHDLLFGPDGRLYIATYTGGLNIYDPLTDRFECINRANTPGFPSDAVYALLTRGDSIFIATEAGLVIYNNHTQKIEPFFQDKLGQTDVTSISLSSNELWISVVRGLIVYNFDTQEFRNFDKLRGPVSISFVEADKHGNIWIGDNFRGVYVYWQAADSLEHYSPYQDFPGKRVFGMVQGQDGNFWISTSNGLVKFEPTSQNAVVFNRQSGLPFTQFNYGAYFRSTSGKIYFGGINGLIYFDEQDDYFAKGLNQAVFTDFELFNKSVLPGTGHVLDNPIHQTKDIRLKYEENVFSIHYSAMNYTQPGQVQYAYMLEGFDPDWNLVGNQTRASYTNLSPGRYTFRVKASLDNTEWSAEETSLQIIVAPPFWLSPLAFFIYAFLFIGGLIVFYFVSVKMEKSKSMLALERQEKAHQEKLNRMKLDFFTNISHELRTPLTLIAGPLSNLIREPDIRGATRRKLEKVNHNVDRLLGLINQLLDFRKADGGQEVLKVRRCNIIHFIHDIKEAFEDLADNKQIVFDLQLNVEKEELYFDPEKLERILFNLLSNAFKYTPEQGHVLLEVKTTDGGLDGEDAYKTLRIKVKDNGAGIPKDQLKNVFERFYQVKSSGMIPTGSGIGLAFVKTLVQLHKGKIKVRSNENHGTIFCLTIPVEAKSYQDPERSESELAFTSKAGEWVDREFKNILSPFLVEVQKGQSPILVVDDNPELLEFLRESLSAKFTVHTATHGLEALAMMEKIRPELLISDIMMPEMDGLELTKRVKENIETSHIPVILLTAKAGVENQFEGFAYGADFYIEKPFYPELLVKHVENLLSTRRRLIELFKKDIYITPAEITHSKSDQEFIEKLTSLVEGHIDNQDLDISFVLKEMCISRSLLHLKLKKIAGCSATEFIRSIRLKKAAKMILTGECSISEAAYSNGFSSPSLFSRRFKEFFGMTPSQYVDSKKEEARKEI